MSWGIVEVVAASIRQNRSVCNLRARIGYGAGGQREYLSDFAGETATRILILEPKRQNVMEDVVILF